MASKKKRRISKNANARLYRDERLRILVFGPIYSLVIRKRRWHHDQYESALALV